MDDHHDARPSVLVASYGFVAGGGETYPIILANALRARGWPVAFLDFGKVQPEPAIREMLRPDVPLYTLQSEAEIASLCAELAVDIVHTSHASVDLGFAQNLEGSGRPKHLVTLHGMYETMPLAHLLGVLPVLGRVDHFTYAAQKNLDNFPKRLLEEKPFTLIPNALPVVGTLPQSRGTLGIPTESLIAMLIARAIPGKGWLTARSAVELARIASGTDIHLVFIGDGPICDLIRRERIPEWMHLLGFQADIRSWISVADVGLLPSTFRGESFPLVLMDFLSMSVPVIASSVGEIPAMMNSELGLAGYLVDAVNGQISITSLAGLIARFALLKTNDVEQLRRCAGKAGEKFDLDDAVDAFEEVYRQLDRDNTGAREIL
jgi:glycosyltransferase involved in cell wall biosynthesis